MKATDLIRMGLTASAAQALALIDDMKDAPFTFPTSHGGNHPLWVLGHQASSESKIINHIMQGQPSPLAHWAGIFGPGTQPTADATIYPPFDEVRKAFDEVRANTLRVLDSLTDADLDQPSKACPPAYHAFLGTVALCFLYVCSHFTYHAGQVADARRAAGRMPLRA